MASTGEETVPGELAQEAPERDDRPLGVRFPFLRKHGARHIEDLAWPAGVIGIRVLEALKRDNVAVLATLAKMTDQYLLLLHNFGEKGLGALHQAIEVTQTQWDAWPEEPEQDAAPPATRETSEVPSFLEGIGEDPATRAERHLLRALEEVRKAKTLTLTLRNRRTGVEVDLELTPGDTLELEVS